LTLSHQFPRRILLLVCGMSPQVVTETIYALAHGNPPWVPTEVHLITTTTGAEQARLNLLQGRRQLARLCADYQLDPTMFLSENIHTIPDHEGKELSDIRSPGDNEATADFITEWVRQLTSDDRSALHVSMAGGRKTMGYYAGYALSLFGRPQDRLSHVLVSEGYEGLSEFYYPTPTPCIVYDRDQRALDASRAQVHLADIPFIRLRQGLPEPLLKGQHSFNESIALGQLAQGEPSLTIDVPRQQLICQGQPVSLPPTRFAFYCWIAQRGEPLSRYEILEITRHKDYAREFLDYYQDLIGEFHANDRVLEALEAGMDKTYLDSAIGDIKRRLEAVLGPILAASYRIHNRNPNQRGRAEYALALDSQQIRWKLQ